MSTTTESNTVVPGTVAAGWYPDAHAAGQVRYFDGQSWTEHTAPAAGAHGTPDLPLAEPAEPKKKKSKKGWIIGGSIAAVLLFGSIAIANGGSDSDAPNPPAASQSDTEEVAVEEVEAVMVTVPTTLVGLTATEALAALDAVGLEGTYEGEPNAKVLSADVTGEVEEGTTVTLVVEQLTLAQQNALGSAQSYIDLMGFSRAGLIQQLSSEYGEGYPVDVATWAADAVGADWNAEAVESAQSYLDTMSFSRDGLFEQLTSEHGAGFTPEQANHALAAVGY